MSLEKVYDGKGNEHTLEGSDGDLLIAKFDAWADGDEIIGCRTHTAADIIAHLESQKPAIASVFSRNRQGFITTNIFCVNQGSCLIVGEYFIDGGWSHTPGQENCYKDGNTENRTIGNELWAEY